MRWIPWILFCIVTITGALLTPSIGPAWDEPDNIFASGQYIKYIASGMDPAVLSSKEADASVFGERIFSQDKSIARYPPFPNYIGAALVLIGEGLGMVHTSADIIVAFHIATTVFFALLVTVMYQFARLFGIGIGASLFAAGVTFLYPTLFGHGFSNLKDTAQVSLFAISLFYLVRGTLKKRRMDYIVAAIIWGLGLASKFNVVYVPIIWGTWQVFYARLFVANENVDPSSVRLRNQSTPLMRMSSLASESGQHFVRAAAAVSTIRGFILVIFVGIVVAFIVWPYLWYDPVGRVREVVSYFMTVGQGYKLFWGGTAYQVGTGTVLWWYPWLSLILTTPVSILILVFIGIVGGFNRRHRGLILLCFIWILVPFARAILPSAAFYDGMRHFMEVLPAWILLSTIGTVELIRLLRKLWKKIPVYYLYFVCVLPLFHLAWINIQYFPYSTGYYNMLAKDPNARFDRDIEALSVQEGVRYLQEKYGAIRVWSPIAGHLSWYYLSQQDRYVYSAAEADSIILVNKASHVNVTEFFPRIQDSFVLDAEIRRGEAIFARVYRKK